MSYKITIDLDDAGKITTSFFNQNNINPLSGSILIAELENVKLRILIMLNKFKTSTIS